MICNVQVHFDPLFTVTVFILYIWKISRFGGRRVNHLYYRQQMYIRQNFIAELLDKIASPEIFPDMQ